MNTAHVSSCAALVLGLALVSTPMATTAKTITVKPGQSIQAAVNAAKPGDTVKVLSGEYIEEHSGTAAVRITKPLKLMASGQVRIVPRDDSQTDGIVVEGTSLEQKIDGVEIVGFTVEGFRGNGIWLAYVENFNIENNVSANNEENGIWPTLSANGQVKNNVAYGSMDSALWVEASENVRVINNDLHHSPTGLEVTISKNVTMENNNIHDNTVGIGLYHPAAAGLGTDAGPQPYGNWRVANNYVHDNNEPNTATGGEVALLPPGLGILLLGVDGVDLQQNRIENHDFVGVGVIDWCVALADPGCLPSPSEESPKFMNSAVDNSHVVGNKFAGNHTGEDLITPIGELPASDILYVDGMVLGRESGTGNCQSDNKLVKTPNPHDPGVLIHAVPSLSDIGVDLLPTCN